MRLSSSFQRYSTVFRLALLIFSATTVVACGFHLRGAVNISQDIAPVYIQKNNAFELAQEIRKLLISNNISLTDTQNIANSHLVLVKEEKNRRVLSVDTNGRVREYLLTYKVDFMIKIKQAEQPGGSLTLTRSLLFDPDAVIAVENESEILYKDMQKDMSRLILLKLQASSLNNATSKQAAEEAISTESGTGEK